jgi:hypothetical protein
MERVGEILSRVLADLQAQFPQEKGNGCCGLPQVHSFTTEPTRPAARVPIAGQPKTSAGDKWDEPSDALELSGGVHDASTATMQAITGRPITEMDGQK